MSYIRLKHTLSEIAIDAVARGRTAPVPWLAAYARLAAPEAPAVPAERLRDEAGDADPAGLRFLVRRGVLTEVDGAVALDPAFRPHLRYADQVAHRLADAVAHLPEDLDLGFSSTMAPGIALFNSGLYFECHEYFEGVWRDTAEPHREFFHGLIQVAAAFYHYEKGNLHGAQRLLDRGTQRLEGYRPAHLNVNVEALLAALARWQDLFVGARRPRSEWTPRLIPRDDAPRIVAAP